MASVYTPSSKGLCNENLRGWGGGRGGGGRVGVGGWEGWAEWEGWAGGRVGVAKMTFRL